MYSTCVHSCSVTSSHAINTTNTLRDYPQNSRASAGDPGSPKREIACVAGRRKGGKSTFALFQLQWVLVKELNFLKLFSFCRLIKSEFRGRIKEGGGGGS